MVKALYAGTFDPITYGHLDIIQRSFNFCNKLVVAIGVNSQKKTLFSEAERFSQIKNILTDVLGFSDNPFDWRVDSFSGLLIDFAKKEKANILIRGIRSVSDFEYELTLAGVNKVLAPDIETIFLPTSPNLAVVSSSAVKEIGKYGGPLSRFVPLEIEKAVRAKFGFEKLPESGFIKYGDLENKNIAGH